MSFDIKEFRGTLQSHGYLKTHSFTVLFGSPKVMSGRRFNIINQDSGESVQDAALTEIPKLMLLRAESAQIPGSIIIGSDSSRYGISPNQKTPTGVVFNDTSFTFIADRFGLLWAYFYYWHNSIFSWDHKAGGGVVPSYTLEYRENYATDIIISVFDPTGKRVMAFKFIDAYPNMIPGAPLNWSQTDQILKLQVGFTYRQWEMVDFSADSSADLPTTTDVWSSTPTSSINNTPTISLPLTA